MLPVGLATLQVSGDVTTHTGVPWTESEEGTTSVTVVEPDPSPTFLATMV